MCKFIKREIAWLCSFLADTADPQQTRVTAFDSLGAFLNAISLMLEQEVDVLTWIPSGEVLHAISILKVNFCLLLFIHPPDLREKQKEDTTDRPLNEGLIMLGEMSFFAPEALVAAPDEQKHVIFYFILHSLIAPHFQQLVTLDPGNSVQSVLQLGRHFATAVHYNLAEQVIDTYLEEWIFESEQEKVDEVIGWANLIKQVVELVLERGGTDIPLMPGLVMTIRGMFRLVFMMIDSEPRFVNHLMDSNGRHLAKDDLTRPMKEAVMTMAKAVCSTTSLDFITSIYGNLLQDTESQRGDMLAVLRWVTSASFHEGNKAI